jgi:hypothetical protein
MIQNSEEQTLESFLQLQSRTTSRLGKTGANRRLRRLDAGIEMEHFRSLQAREDWRELEVEDARCGH